MYERMGLTPIINAAGTLTRLGGTVMLPEARDAMAEAANALVPIDELQALASQAIAQACGSEAGYVTSGASAALTLAAAACMVGLDIVKMDQLPNCPGAKNEIIICRPHRNSYDHAFRAAGAAFVEVGMSDRQVGAGVRETEPWEIEAAISEKTAAIAYTASPNSCPALSEVTGVARRHGVPVIVDAAGQLPPPANLRRYISEGADLVAFSGGKAIRGPQGTGFLAGRRDLIASVALQQLDMDVSFDSWAPPSSLIPKDALRGVPRHGLGRGFKVAKEQIVGFIVALGMFTEERVIHDYERWVGLLEALQQDLAGCPGLKTRLLLPHEPYGFPRLEVEVTERVPGKNSRALASSLRAGSPPIYVGEGKVMDGSILIHPVNLDDQSVAVITERLTSWRHTTEIR